MTRVPERIGRYAVAGESGRGGFATVLRAHDETLQSVVAIKVLAANWAPDPAMRERFVAEARLLRRADSDRVVRVHDIGELPDGRPYFVMTYADRGTLAQRVGATPVPWRQAVTVAVDITRALCVLHAAGILHRDVKPSNVLFRSLPGGGEQLLLGDLGLGKLLGHTSGMTLLGGTPGFMAPEQGFAGVPVGVGTDVYGVGAVLYRALTGLSPHDPEVVVYPADPHPAVAPGSLVPGLPTALDQAVLRAIAHDPRNRQPDTSVLLAELERLLATPPAATPPATPGPAGVATPGSASGNATPGAVAPGAAGRGAAVLRAAAVRAAALGAALGAAARGSANPAGAAAPAGSAVPGGAVARPPVPAPPGGRGRPPAPTPGADPAGFRPPPVAGASPAAAAGSPAAPAASPQRAGRPLPPTRVATHLASPSTPPAGTPRPPSTPPAGTPRPPSTPAAGAPRPPAGAPGQQAGAPRPSATPPGSPSRPPYNPPSYPAPTPAPASTPGGSGRAAAPAPPADQPRPATAAPAPAPTPAPASSPAPAPAPATPEDAAADATPPAGPPQASAPQPIPAYVDEDLPPYVPPYTP